MLKPLILNPQNSKDALIIERIKNNGAIVVDSYKESIKELFQIRNPSCHSSKKMLADFIRNHKQDESTSWIFYPWNNYLVRILSEQFFTELRTARNRNLITTKEQKLFYESNVGIAGLSVGNSVAAAIVFAGGAKNMKLADFDKLSISNLNRIRTSLVNFGKKKTEIISREIYEINPYSKLEIYDKGLNMEVLNDFFIGTKPLNIIVDEMDNLYLKVQLRIMAKKHKIPVVMATDNGENVVIDIERYDLYPERRIFNTNIPESTLYAIKPEISKLDAARIISGLVGVENIADRMLESLLQLGSSLYSWPQLGTAATVGGCAVAHVVRSIVVGNKINEGKHFINIDSLFRLDDYNSPASQKNRKHLQRTFRKIFRVE